jgi:hypothetical protein
VIGWTDDIQNGTAVEQKVDRNYFSRHAVILLVSRLFPLLCVTESVHVVANGDNDGSRGHLQLTASWSQ